MLVDLWHDLMNHPAGYISYFGGVVAVERNRKDRN